MALLTKIETSTKKIFKSSLRSRFKPIICDFFTNTDARSESGILLTESSTENKICISDCQRRLTRRVNALNVTFGTDLHEPY
jgi:hypothetical protein